MARTPHTPRAPRPPGRVQPAVRLAQGLSLIELLVALCIAGVLATVAYPGLQSTILRLRRAEALSTFAQFQTAQQRHRSRHLRYATLNELGLPLASASGRYLYSEVVPDSSRYAILAVAQGAQASDTLCAHLALRVDGLDVEWRSGPNEELANLSADNRRCWSR
jgi:type IV pilus assembly protein PilE